MRRDREAAGTEGVFQCCATKERYLAVGLCQTECWVYSFGAGARRGCGEHCVATALDRVAAAQEEEGGGGEEESGGFGDGG